MGASPPVAHTSFPVNSGGRDRPIERVAVVCEIVGSVGTHRVSGETSAKDVASVVFCRSPRMRAISGWRHTVFPVNDGASHSGHPRETPGRLRRSCYPFRHMEPSGRHTRSSDRHTRPSGRHTKFPVKSAGVVDTSVCALRDSSRQATGSDRRNANMTFNKQQINTGVSSPSTGTVVRNIERDVVVRGAVESVRVLVDLYSEIEPVVDTELDATDPRRANWIRGWYAICRFGAPLQHTSFPVKLTPHFDCLPPLVSLFHRKPGVCVVVALPLPPPAADTT